MATGTVKVFHTDRNFGFLTSEGGDDVYVHADQVDGGSLTPGDVVEFEVEDEDGRDRSAVSVKVVKAAPAENPVGRTMAAPPTWDALEERERQRRAARRRRR
jgi:cold shock CspA family protein